MARFNNRFPMAGFSMEVRRERIDAPVLAATEPDPNWRYVDAAGHGHFHDRAAESGYPTLRWVEDDPGGMGPDGEEYGPTGHWQCPGCGEHVVPGRRIAPQPVIYGPVTVEVGRRRGRETVTWVLPEDRWNELCDAAEAAADRVLDGCDQYVTDRVYGW